MKRKSLAKLRNFHGPNDIFFKNLDWPVHIVSAPRAEAAHQEHCRVIETKCLGTYLKAFKINRLIESSKPSKQRGQSRKNVVTTLHRLYYARYTLTIRYGRRLRPEAPIFNIVFEHDE